MLEKELANKHLEKIKSLTAEIGRSITLMEICGGHTNTIMKYGIRDVLPKNLRPISGPGCPVCVSPAYDIDCISAIAGEGVPVATYGDMMRVPGSSGCLDDARAQGAKIFEVYCAEEVLKLKEKYPDIVFFGIGFETTAPMTAFLLEKGVCIYSMHKLIPPAIKHLAMGGDMRIDGFIIPGHVSAIIGAKPYKIIKVPQAIAGFSPEQILRAICFVLELIKDNKNIVINCYPEAVRECGNKKAKEMLNKHFNITNSIWRGLGIVPDSGLEAKNPGLNAKIVFKKITEKVKTPKKTACRCAEILKGVIEPTDCPLYKKICTPNNPVGACMVSEEGACSIYFKYGK